MADNRKRSFFDFSLQADLLSNMRPRKRETLKEHNRRVRGEEPPPNEEPPPWPPQGPNMSECPLTSLFLSSDDDDDDDDDEEEEKFDGVYGDGSSDEQTRVYETRQEVWGTIIQYRDSKGVQHIHEVIPKTKQQETELSEEDVVDNLVEVAPRRKRTRRARVRRESRSEERRPHEDEILGTLRPANQPPASRYVSIKELNELGHKAFEDLDKRKIDGAYNPDTMDLNFKHQRIIPRMDSHRTILERTQHQSGYTNQIIKDIEYSDRPVIWNEATEHNRLPFEPRTLLASKLTIDSAYIETLDPALLGGQPHRSTLIEGVGHTLRQRSSTRTSRRDRFGRLGTKSKLSSFTRPPRSPLPNPQPTLEQLPKDDVEHSLDGGLQEVQKVSDDELFAFDPPSEEARARAYRTGRSRPSQRRTLQLKSSFPIPSQPESQSLQGTDSERLFGFDPPHEEQRASQPMLLPKQPKWIYSKWMKEFEDPTKKFWFDER